MKCRKKKTTESRPITQPAQSPSPKPTESPRPPEAKPVVAEKASPEPAPVKAEETKAVQEPVVKPTPPPPVAPAPPKTSGLLSLEAFDDEVIKEDGQESKVNLDLKLEDVEEAWRKYANEEVESPSLKNTLSNAELSFENQQIIAVVGSTMKQSLIQQDNKLMDFLKNELNNPMLMLSCHVDPSKKVEIIEKPKMLTPKEIYDQMKQENAQVEEMRRRFDLGIDND